jgi:hypothetical protein
VSSIVAASLAYATTSTDSRTDQEPVDVTEVGFGALVSLLPGVVTEHPFVNPLRCVYLVTVHVPYVVVGPTGAGEKFPAYSTIVDEATGEEILFHAGPTDLTTEVNDALRAGG